MLQTAFQMFQEQELLDGEETGTALALLADAFENFSFSLDTLVYKYFHGNHISYLRYRSGLQFLTAEWGNIATETPPPGSPFLSRFCEVFSLIKF